LKKTVIERKGVQTGVLDYSLGQEEREAEIVMTPGKIDMEAARGARIKGVPALPTLWPFCWEVLTV